MTSHHLIGAGIFVLTLAIDLITDYRIWAQKKTVNHLRGALLRLIGFIPAIWLTGWIGLLLIPVYGTLFDGIYGLLIVRDWFYIGTTSALDKLKRKHPWLIVFQYAMAIAGVIIFITW